MAWQRQRKRKIPGPVFGCVIMLLGFGILLIDDRKASRYAEIANASDTVTGRIIVSRRNSDRHYVDYEYSYKDETFLMERVRVQPAFYDTNREGAAVEVLVPRHAPDQAILADNRYFGWIPQLAGLVMVMIGAVVIAAPLWRKFRPG